VISQANLAGCPQVRWLYGARGDPDWSSQEVERLQSLVAELGVAQVGRLAGGWWAPALRDGTG
jgi:hypothetical protein